MRIQVFICRVILLNGNVHLPAHILAENALAKRESCALLKYWDLKEDGSFMTISEILRVMYTERECIAR